MKSALLLWITTLLAMRFSVAAEPHAEVSAAAPTAYITDLSGLVSIRASTEATPEPLVRELDVGRALFVGQVLRLNDTARVELCLAEGTRTLNGPLDFTVPSPDEHRSDAMQALERFFRSGGRTRSATAGSPIFSPVAESAVWAENFEVRWERTHWNGTLRFSLANEDGVEIWSQTGVPADTGVLEPSDARQRLNELRQPSERSEFTLGVEAQGGHKFLVSFYLLSRTDETALARELAKWETEPAGSWVRHAGRAAVFLHHSLLNEAVREYDEALALAGRSRALLLAASEINRRTGNLARAEELRRRAENGP